MLFFDIMHRRGVNMNLPKHIKRISESREPLSCHCFVIEGKDNTWIFDVGASDEAFEEINAIDNKCIVLSHFHEDHISNIKRLNCDNIYQGEYTFKHTQKGDIVNDEIVIADGLEFRIFPLPNTHAKGSIGLEIDDYAFLGDAIFPSHINGHHAYNSTLLKDEIETLKKSTAKYFILSHNDEFVYTKEDMIARLERVYAKRNPKEPYINLD